MGRTALGRGRPVATVDLRRGRETGELHECREPRAEIGIGEDARAEEERGLEQRVIELTRDVQDAFIASIRTQLNNAMAGNSLPEVADRISGIIEGYSKVDRRDISLIVSAVIETAIEKPEEKVVLAGTANLARFSDDFPTTMHPVLEALEEQVVLLRLLGDANDTIKVRIGGEQSESNLRQTSLVTVGYGASESPVGALGILHVLVEVEAEPGLDDRVDIEHVELAAELHQVERAGVDREVDAEALAFAFGQKRLQKLLVVYFVDLRLHLLI